MKPAVFLGPSPAPRREWLHANQVFSSTDCQEGLGSTPLGTAYTLHHSASVGSLICQYLIWACSQGGLFLISHSGLVTSWHPFHLTTFRKRPRHLSQVLPHLYFTVVVTRVFKLPISHLILEWVDTAFLSSV